MSELNRDYFQELDLNPVVNGANAPVNAPLDPRAMHYFGFLANGQAIQLLTGLPAGSRVLYSWRYAQAPGVGPAAVPPQADGVLDFAGGPAVMRYDVGHERAHVLVWLDGAAQQQAVTVRISAWCKA